MNTPPKRITPHKRATLSSDVASEVRAHLARHRLSGRRAALALGWTQPYMSRRLTGEIPFDVADLEAIADLLGIPVVAFFQAPPAYLTTVPARPSPGFISERSLLPLRDLLTIAAA
jgi:transcriptional regulator with XRE-family HTH domain